MTVRNKPNPQNPRQCYYFSEHSVLSFNKGKGEERYTWFKCALPLTERCTRSNGGQCINRRRKVR